MMIRICRYNELPSELQFVLESANCFFSKEYMNYLECTGCKAFYGYDDNWIIPIRVKTVLNIFKQATLISEPFCLKSKYSQTEQFFLDEIIARLRSDFKIDWVPMTPTSALFNAYPLNSERIKFGNYVLDLNRPEEDIFSGFTSKHRNMVRRGEKSDLVISFGDKELLDDYLLLDRATWSRSNKSIDNRKKYSEYLEKLSNHSIVAIAYKDSIPQCGILGFYNKQMFYYMFGASANNPVPGSTHYLQWRTMLYLKALWVKTYNFVGCRINEDVNSKYHNIQHFKKGFGGELKECYLFKTTFSKKKLKLFNLLLRLKNGVYPSDIIDEEIYKWTEIN